MIAAAHTEIPAYLTVKEAAALLRVHTRTIENRIRSRQLPAKKLAGGRTLLIDPQDVLALLQDAWPQGIEDQLWEHDLRKDMTNAHRKIRSAVREKNELTSRPATVADGAGL